MGHLIEISAIGVFAIALAVIFLAIRHFGKRWNFTRADTAILLIATVFGYIFFNPTFVVSYLYPSPLAMLAPFVSIALGLMLGVFILLILQKAR